jgi:uncharacterized delta-60 repeat protein
VSPRKIALGSKKVRRVLLAITGFAVLLPGAIAQAAPGDLRPSFGTGGRATALLDVGLSFGEDVILQPDGKVVAVGRGADDFVIARYLPDGSLDATFSGDGLVTVDFNGTVDTATAVGLQSDGKIVIGGEAGTADELVADVAVARLTSTGALDTSFGTGGRRVFDAGGQDRVGDMAVGSDDTIAIVSVATQVGNFNIARLTATGALDPSFSDDGQQTVDFGLFDQPFAVTVQPDGKILAGGRAQLGGTDTHAITRLNASGTLDTTFDGDGRFTQPSANGNGSSLGIRDLIVQPDTKILAVGGTRITRLDADASLDTSFDSDGSATVPIGGLQRVNRQSDGRIVVAGSEGFADFAAVRLTATGSVDTTFDADGKQTIDLGGDEAALGMVVQADDRIVLAGSTREFNERSGDLSLVRLVSNGGLDASFSVDGKVITVVPGASVAQSISVAPDGRIVLAGDAGGVAAGVARLTAAGTLDPTFDGDGRQFQRFPGATTVGGVAVASDGDVVVVGSHSSAFIGSTTAFVIRYNAAGVLDTSFSGDGVATIGGGFGASPANAVVIQPDGKIVVAGRFGSNYLSRLNADGTTDASFTPEVLTGWADQAYGLIRQSDGKLVVAGGGYFGSTFDLWRHNANGALDTTFSLDGKERTTVGANSYPTSVSLLGDKIALAGGNFASNSVEHVARYSADGTPDTSFGPGGVRSTTGRRPAQGVALQPGGVIVTVSASANAADGDLQLRRFSSSGVADASFGNQGIVLTDFAGGRDAGNAVAIAADGDIIAAGLASLERGAFAAARYDGQLPNVDTTAPETTITSGPSEGNTTSDSTPTFEFSSSEPGSTFSCRIDTGSPAACVTPLTTSTLPDGHHVFKVSATDTATNTDASPATRTFTVQTAVTPPPPPPVAPPPPPPVAPPPPSVVDTTAPAAKLTGAAQKLATSIAVTVSCTNEACTATTSASIRVPLVGATLAKTYKLKTVTKQLAKGQKVTIKLKLSAAARKAIKRALSARKRVVAKIKLTVTDAAGNKRTLDRRIQLER